MEFDKYKISNSEISSLNVKSARDTFSNGNVQEITLNTVKVRNWDNTISTIPPYTLVSSTFKNWRGMAESDGRRVDKRIFLDLCSLEFCTEDMIADIRKSVPLLADYEVNNQNNSTLSFF